MTAKRNVTPLVQPAPGDWLVYTEDRQRLLEFGPDLAAVRQRLAERNVRLADCFLSRLPTESDDLLLGSAELEIV